MGSTFLKLSCTRLTCSGVMLSSVALGWPHAARARPIDDRGEQTIKIRTNRSQPGNGMRIKALRRTFQVREASLGCAPPRQHCRFARQRTILAAKQWEARR